MRKKSESGYVLVTVAAMLFVLVGFTALAVDMGTILSSRTQIQRAADAAALAGAFTFTVNGDLADQPARAIEQATKTATSNVVMGIPIPNADVTVTVEMPDPLTNKPALVTVTIQRTEPTVFARVLSVNGVADRVTAIAESGIAATAASCVKPFFIPNTVLSTLDPCAATTAGETLVDRAVSPAQPTAFALNKIATNTNGLTLHPNNANTALASGQFYEIDINKGGGSAYGDNISHCNTFQFVCQSSYDVLTGAKVGPTIKGVDDLIGKPPVDVYRSVGHYEGPDGISDISKALILAPITDLTAVDVNPWGAKGFCPSPQGTCTDPDPSKCEQFPTGSNVQLPIVGFAVIFVDGTTGGTVTGHLVKVVPCGAAPPVNQDSGVFGVPLRLVRKP